MDSSYDACRALLPSPYELYQPNRTASAVGTSSLNPSLDDPIPAPRRPKAGIKTAQQWQEQAAIIQKLYEIDGLTLEATMKSMNENHGFQASIRQYKAKIKERVLEKNFKNKDMQAIVRKDSKRKTEHPHKATRFRCCKRQVPQHRIERYRRDHGSSDETIMGDASTPSDISCETPRSIYSSDHPSLVQHSSKTLKYVVRDYLINYCGICSSVPRSAARTCFAYDDFATHSAAGPTPYATKLIDDQIALNSTLDDLDSPLFGCFAVLKYRGLLQPLISKLQIDHLLGAIVSLARERGVDYQPATAISSPWCPAAATNVAIARLTGQLLFWDQWPAYRLSVVYVHAMAGTASIRTLAVKIETFTNEVCVPDFGLTFPVLAGNFLPFLSRTEVGGLIASFGHTLRARGCRCELVEKLPSVLLFETLLETYRYIALGIAGTSTLDHHHRLNMAGERITTWLQAPYTLAELHRC